MSEASLKKGPAWGLSTTLDAGRLDAGRFGCGSSITLIIYAIELTPGGIRGEEPLFCKKYVKKVVMLQPFKKFFVGWVGSEG